MDIIKYGRAICYSGYRKGHHPGKAYPSYEQILEDLRILETDFDYIRMYDSGQHAKDTLEVIRKENIDLKVLIGMDLLGEIHNVGCSWGGRYTEAEIAKHIEYNQNQLHQAINLANEYKEQILAVSAGNESVPEWNENLLSPGRVLYFVQQLKKYTTVPVTYCDNNYYWRNKLKEVAKNVDFISIHIYPVWLGKHIESAIPMCINEYNEINNMYPEKQVIITETGWPTNSNNGQIPSVYANELNQKFYNTEVERWAEKNEITTFFFEAFDEYWKGSDNPDEPEKHWGYYFDNRTPKLIKK